MKFDLTILKNRAVKYPLLAILLLSGLVYLKTISVKITEAKIKKPDGTISKISNPYKAKSTGKKHYTYFVKIRSGINQQKQFNIRVIDIINRMTLNGNDISFTEFMKKYKIKKMNEWYYGIFISLPLKKGINTLEIKSFDIGYHYGFSIHSKLTSVDLLILFLLWGIPALLLLLKLFWRIFPFLQSLRHKPKYWNLPVIIIIAGILIRLVFLLSTSSFYFAHDHKDHLRYLEFTSDYFEVPSITMNREFPQQPLYYLISGTIIRIQQELGLSFQQAIRGLQFVSLTFSILFLLYSYKFLRILTKDRRKISVALGFLAFTPSFIYLSVRVSNDLMIMMWGAIICWQFAVFWKKMNTKNFIKLTVFMALAFFTKITAALFPLVLLFFLLRKLWIYWKSDLPEQNNSRKAVIRMTTALVITFSLLGSLAVLRSYIPSHKTLHFVRSGKYKGQVIKNIDLSYFASFRLDKLLEQGSSHIFYRDRSVQESFFTFQYGTMMFGEFNYNFVQNGRSRPRSFKFTMIIIYLLGSVLVAGLISFILFKKHQPLFLRIMGITVLINLGLIVFFLFRYPSYCNTDFRYYAAVFPVFAAMIAFGIDYLTKRFPRSEKFLYRTVNSLYTVQFLWLIWISVLFHRL